MMSMDQASSSVEPTGVKTAFEMMQEMPARAAHSIVSTCRCRFGRLTVWPMPTDVISVSRAMFSSTTAVLGSSEGVTRIPSLTSGGPS